MNGLASEHRSSGAGWLALAAGLAVALPGVAQDVELEEIIVTGSRIARPDFESASPIVSITQERFRETGATSVEIVMNRLPQLVPDQTSTSNNPGNDGQAHLQLRGLGFPFLLVFLLGRRHGDDEQQDQRRNEGDAAGIDTESHLFTLRSVMSSVGSWTPENREHTTKAIRRKGAGVTAKSGPGRGRSVSGR